tara:strand:- start:201 stop:347 length:147 start_codon:yes stop_codon:yes gene_type:complete
MARIFTKTGEELILPTEKRTYQGSSKNTKYSKKSNSSRRKPYRGQGRK